MLLCIFHERKRSCWLSLTCSRCVSNEDITERRQSLVADHRPPRGITARGRRLSRIDSTGSMRKNWQNSFGATRKLFPFASNAVTPYMLSTSTSCIKRRGKPPLATSSHAISRLRAAPQTRPIWHWCANPTPQSVMHDSICPVVGPSGFLAIVAPGLNPH